RRERGIDLLALGVGHYVVRQFEAVHAIGHHGDLEAADLVAVPARRLRAGGGSRRARRGGRGEWNSRGGRGRDGSPEQAAARGGGGVRGKWNSRGGRGRNGPREQAAAGEFGHGVPPDQSRSRHSLFGKDAAADGARDGGSHGVGRDAVVIALVETDSEMLAPMA